jgi:hypothetical protein
MSNKNFEKYNIKTFSKKSQYECNYFFIYEFSNFLIKNYKYSCEFNELARFILLHRIKKWIPPKFVLTYL